MKFCLIQRFFHVLFSSSIRVDNLVWLKKINLSPLQKLFGDYLSKNYFRFQMLIRFTLKMVSKFRPMQFLLYCSIHLRLKMTVRFQRGGALWEFSSAGVENFIRASVRLSHSEVQPYKNSHNKHDIIWLDSWHYFCIYDDIYFLYSFDRNKGGICCSS